MKFFVEYLEDSPVAGLVTRDKFGTVTDHYTKGPCVHEHAGFRRKKDAVAYCARLNATAGRAVVVLWNGLDKAKGTP